MNMPTWLGDVHPLTNNENGAFDPTVDPSTAFMQNATSNPLDFNQFQNLQHQQRLQNGNMRNGSPAFHNPNYQTQPIIPSKRPRPREESIGASPRQMAGGLPASRSQTPQQGQYTGTQSAVNGGQQPQPSVQYPQFPAGNNSTGAMSPIKQAQNLASQPFPQRVQTMSPSPFSPTPQNFGPSASPAHSDHGSRVNTPQSGAQTFAQGLPYGASPSSNFSTPHGTEVAHSPPHSSQSSLNFQHQQQQRQKMQHEQYLRQLHAAQPRQPGIPMPNQPNGMAIHQMNSARAQQPGQPVARLNPENFLRDIASFMQSKSLPWDPNPRVSGHSIPLVQLFSIVIRMGGSNRAAWQNIPTMLGISHAQAHIAAQELRRYWDQNLAHYEHYYIQRAQRQRAEQQRTSQPLSNGDVAMPSNQMSQMRTMHPQAHDTQRFQNMQNVPNSQGNIQNVTRQATAQQLEQRQRQQNGLLQPQINHFQSPTSSMYNMAVPGATPASQAAPLQAQQPGIVADAAGPTGKKHTETGRNAATNQSPVAAATNPTEELTDTYKRAAFYRGTDPSGINNTHGGVPVAYTMEVNEVAATKETMPRPDQLGTIDVAALTLSLRSGIPGEVRLALDIFTSLSQLPWGRGHIELKHCDELVEILVECAEEQIDSLAEHATEVSEDIMISPYEELCRACRLENKALQEFPEPGTTGYNLERSVDRLLSVITIFRNCSCERQNLDSLKEPTVIKFVASAMRYLGTRNMLLRSYRNALDFTKDAVFFLSNISEVCDLPGKEEALCILHFLLSFAPMPPPSYDENAEVIFTPYDRSLHKYLPFALNGFANLLARDDPNRSFYRSVFAADSAVGMPQDLLTRAFAFAVAPVLEFSKVDDSARPFTDSRSAILSQGMLTAEILIGLIPAADSTLGRLWLFSADGFAPILLRIIGIFGAQEAYVRDRHGRRLEMHLEHESPRSMIMRLATSLLRRLAEKAKDTDSTCLLAPNGIFPSKEYMHRTLFQPGKVEEKVLVQLCALADMAA